MKMTSNEETLTYKVVDLVESSNFHIKFTSITAVGPYRRPPRRQMYSFAKKFGPYIFAKLTGKNCKKRKISQPKRLLWASEFDGPDSARHHTEKNRIREPPPYIYIPAGGRPSFCNPIKNR
jgi:hypothetical protein